MNINMQPTFGGFNLDDVLKNEEKKKREQAKGKTLPPETPLQPDPGFSIYSWSSISAVSDYYRVTGVRYRNGGYNVDLAKQLLDKGASHTQSGWRAYLEKDQDEGFTIGSAPLYHALFKALYENRNVPQYKELIEKARTFLKDTLDHSLVTTMSTLGYGDPHEKDSVHHCVGFSSLGYNYSGLDIVGPEGYVKVLRQSAKEFMAILEDDNVQEIDNVYHWIGGKDVYLCRLESKPQKHVEKVVHFGILFNGCRLFLDARGGFDKLTSALGIRCERVTP